MARQPLDQILPCRFRLLQPDSRSLLSLEEIEDFTGIFFGKPLDFPYQEFPYRGHNLRLLRRAGPLARPGLSSVCHI